MSRFLLATFGSLGDLHPYVAMGKALASRGHSAVIATSLDYREIIQAQGLEFAEVAPSLASFGDREDLARRLFRPVRGTELMVRALVMPHLRQAHADLTRAAAGADLLVSHPLTLTVPLVARQQNLPWVSTFLAPLSLMSAEDPPLLDGAPWMRALRRYGGRGAYRAAFGLVRAVTRRWEAPLRAFRQELGLPPSDKQALFEGQFSPLCNLGLFDPMLAAPQSDWPVNTTLCGMPLFDGATPSPAEQQDLQHFLAAGDPPLVFALGSSAIWIAGDYWQHAIEAARRLGLRAILLTGKPPAGALPDFVRSYAYLPYSLVFGRARAVIHQAGIGTLAQALRAGAPQLITPAGFDQPDNARRAQQLGVASVLPLRRVTAARLHDALAQLLSQPAIAAVARDVAGALVATDGAAVAAEQLLRCLPRR